MPTGWSTFNEPFKLLRREQSPHAFEIWIRLVGLILAGNRFASDIREVGLWTIGGVGGTCGTISTETTKGVFLWASLRLKDESESLFVFRTAR